MLNRLLRNQKGLTLIELLAVIVILGIIAAIAVPSIGNIIENSKKDAHIANAEQMVSAARLAKAANVDGDIATNTYSMEHLVSEGFLESVPESPGNAGGYNKATSRVVYNPGDSTNDPSYTISLTTGSKFYINSQPITKLRSDTDGEGRDLVGLDADK
ncbi:type II secretion system protein [Bacillus tianshenii]|nr:type II secretion system protein [Bacillus tianshenii]